MSNNNNINSIIIPSTPDPPWMLLVAVADDDVDNDPNYYDKFYVNYDLDIDSVFDNDNAGICGFSLKMSTIMMLS